MRCPRCGTSLEAGAHFCGVCGLRLSSSGASAAASAAASASRPMGKQQGMPRSAPVVAPPRISAVGAVAEHGDPYVGRTLHGRFKIEKKLGEGGFGAVYRGVQTATGRVVALKLLHPEMTRDDNVVARFRREGQVLCSLRDAHTITTYDFDQTDDGTLFIAMELLQGRSLHDVFHDEAPIAWPRMLKIIAETCSSLHEAHGQGIVHRDLKPENIYLENRPGNPEFVKVLDFGIAKVVRGDGIAGLQGAPQLTATGQTLGTLEYMSPEQLMGKPLDGRSDIYGLGVVAFELITGRLPFPDAVGPAALISAQLKKVPPRPSDVLPSGAIPSEVDGVILRMLEKDKDKRFKDVAELRIACEQLLAGGTSPSVTPAPASSPGLPMGTIYLTPPTAPTPQPIAAQHQQPVPVPLATPAPMAVQATPMPALAPHVPIDPLAVPPSSPIPVHRPSTPPPASGQGPSTEDALRASRKGSALWTWFVVAFAVMIAGGIVAMVILSR